ncbi:telomere length regulation protein-domain-containing protein [Phascolomyces articulosus]|uniref:Telomere length regulation protein-domain-containing protein n=1 Tax=Phascolomyces articulosus TaxID=60185 RepID=A0AAD5JVE2_9FUNG|nr:telomere length regulation protein-domain-containing protein [Phascolomyces articulosus]
MFYIYIYVTLSSFYLFKKKSTMTDPLRILDDATLPENKPDLDAIRQCLEQPLKWKRTTLKPIAWKHHIRTIAQTVIPNWAYAFNTTTSNTLRSTLEETFLRLPKVSLPILLDCLSQVNLSALEIYIDLLKSLTITMTDLTPYADDRFFCNLLCSVPTRIANAIGLGGTESWYIDTHYFARLARHVARQTQPYGTLSSAYAGELLGRMIRLGHANVCISAIYPIILDQQGKGWSAIWTVIESYASMGKITETILQLVQKNQQQHPGIHKSIKSIQKIASQLAMVLFGVDGKSSIRIEQFLSFAYIRLANASWTNTNTLRIALTTAIYAQQKNVQGLDETSVSPESLCMVNTLICRLIDKWADPVFLKHGSYKEQEYITAGLVYTLGYLSSDQIETLMNETALRGFIHRWFEYSDTIKMKLAVVLAETISELTEEGSSRLNFGILKEPEDSTFLVMKTLAEKRDALKKVELNGLTCDGDDDEEETNGPIIEDYSSPPVSGDEQQDEELDPDAILTGDQESEDEDDEFEPYPMEESESDDEALHGGSDTGARKKRVKAPVYIQDLIVYLKDDEDPVKLDVGLSSAEQLIRDKANAGSELNESAIELAKRLIGFTTAYDLENTTERQKLSLAALIATVPETVTGYIIDQIFDRNTSMEQKSTLFASIILAVRELAGTSIPENNKRQDELSLELEKQLSLEESKSSTSIVGKPRVFSRRMDIEKKKITHRNRLSGIAGPVFFFPLLVGWWEGARGKARSWLGRDALLAERFVMTLLVIMHGATNLPERGRIVTEYFEFALPLRFISLPQPVTRSLLLGFDIIVNVNYGHQGDLLLQEYPQQLVETKNWLEDIMEMVNADDLKQVALRILARLMEISISA